MVQIKAPNSNYSGISAGVQFKDGVGETDDEGAIAYFGRAGYDVGSDDFAVDNSDQEGTGIDVLGALYSGPEDPIGRDAADPRNDMIPVGGVKADGEIVVGKSKGKRVARVPVDAVSDPNTTAEAPAPEPGSVGAPVQETGDPNTQSANPSTPNPPEATVPNDDTSSDDTSADDDKSKES